MAEKKYFTIAEAAKMLQVSQRVLKNYIPELKHGKHYQDRRKRGARKANLFFNVEAILEYWNTQPELRKTTTTIRKATKLYFKTVTISVTV
jgi:hypothetical protein